MIRHLFIVWCRLKTFEAASETDIKCLLDLGPPGSHVSPLYGEKSWNVYQKPLFLFRLRKERHGHLGWHGGE